MKSLESTVWSPDTRRTNTHGTRKIFVFALLAGAFMILPLARAESMEIAASGGAGNTGFDKKGKLPADIGALFSLGVKTEMTARTFADIQIAQDPVFGRFVSAEFTYDAGLIQFSAGPVFGFLNEGQGDADAPLLQPGLRLGFSMLFLDAITLEASSDFCIRSADDASGQLYPSRARIALGAAFPAVLCTVAINQKAAFTSGDDGYKQTLTDYGFFTEIFGKTSPVTFNVDFMYRTIAFTANDPEVSSLSDTSVGSIVIGGGVELRFAKAAVFLNGHGSVYTFKLKGDDVNNPALYDVSAGVRFFTDAF